MNDKCVTILAKWFAAGRVFTDEDIDLLYQLDAVKIDYYNENRGKGISSNRMSREMNELVIKKAIEITRDN